MRIEENPESAAAEGDAAAQPAATEAADGAEAPEERREKVIVRSDGTVTYVGKDMAYQLWKFGTPRQGLPLPRFRRRAAAALVDQLHPAADGDRRSTRSVAPRGSATSSTRGSRICRSC